MSFVPSDRSLSASPEATEAEPAPEAVPEEAPAVPEEAPAVPAQALAPDPAATDLSALDGIASDLNRVEEALRRLEDPSAGLCEVCGSDIGTERLRNDPLATRCGAHAGAGPFG